MASTLLPDEWYDVSDSEEQPQRPVTPTTPTTLRTLQEQANHLKRKYNSPTIQRYIKGSLLQASQGYIATRELQGVRSNQQKKNERSQATRRRLLTGEYGVITMDQARHAILERTEDEANQAALVSTRQQRRDLERRKRLSQLVHSQQQLAEELSWEEPIVSSSYDDMLVTGPISAAPQEETCSNPDEASRDPFDDGIGSEPVYEANPRIASYPGEGLLRFN